MKRFFVFALAVVLFGACSTQERDFQTPIQDDVVFYASFEQPADIDTKVYANEDLHLRWTADDRVSIFNKNTYNQQYAFTGMTGDNSGGFQKVESDEFVTGNAISNVVSVYPYQASANISEDEVITVTLPAEQMYAENSFGLGANTMVSVSSDNFLQYKNAGGYLMIKLYGEGVSVSSVTLKGNNGEKLAGKASVTMPLDGMPSVEMANEATTEITLTCNTPVQLGATEEESIHFWFVVPPVVFSKGFTITVSEPSGGFFEKSTSKSIAIERNTLSKMAPMEVDLSIPKNVIYYTSSNEDVISVFESAFDVKIVSNKYVDGLGIITFDGDVTSIGDYAFSDNTLITSMTIPGGVTSIGVGAFNYCSSLTSINLPKSVRSIGAWAFSECTSLTESITIPESMTSIGIGAFCDCRSLSSFKGKYASSDGVYLIVDGSIIAVAGGAIGGEVIIPEGVTSIGGYSFEGYTTFTSVSFPEGFTSIGEYAFCLCTGLVALTIPGAVTSIGYRAFYKCSSLANLTISEGITSIGNDAFYDCTSLANFTIPESVTSIGNNAFHGCTSLASLTIPENVTSIGNNAFYDCTSLANLTMSEGVTNIGSYAFCGCTSLTSITIPESVTSIGSGAFSRCYSISSFKGKYSSDDGLFLIDSGEIIAIAYAAFQDNVIIPNGVTAIGGGAFSDCTSLTSITIPEGVTSIGSGAFSGCTSLTSITIPEGVTSIGISAFLGCSSLTSVIVLPVMPPQCGSNAFSGTNNCPIFVPAEGIEAYLSAKEWSRYADRIQAIIPLPEAVDLGLPSGVKWASFNLGASKPEEYGDYYAWGETEPYYSSLDPLMWKNGKEKGYDWPSYQWCKGTLYELTKYCDDPDWGYDGFTDNLVSLEPEDDAAYVKLGGKWRMPTIDEEKELRTECSWEYTTLNGINGHIVTGPNGNSIFMPAAGRFYCTSPELVGSEGYFWSVNRGEAGNGGASFICFEGSKTYYGTAVRSRGYSIRPVCAE